MPARKSVNLEAELARMRDALAEARVIVRRSGDVPPVEWDALIGSEPRCPFCGALPVKSETTSFASSMQHECTKGHAWVTL